MQAEVVACHGEAGDGKETGLAWGQAGRGAGLLVASAKAGENDQGEATGHHGPGARFGDAATIVAADADGVGVDREGGDGGSGGGGESGAGKVQLEPCEEIPDGSIAERAHLVNIGGSPIDIGGNGGAVGVEALLRSCGSRAGKGSVENGTAGDAVKQQRKQVEGSGDTEAKGIAKGIASERERERGAAVGGGARAGGAATIAPDAGCGNAVGKGAGDEHSGHLVAVRSEASDIDGIDGGAVILAEGSDHTGLNNRRGRKQGKNKSHAVILRG